MANQEHLDVLHQGVDIWNNWRQKNLYIPSPDFSKADLNGADLKFADLRGANLSGANLKRANLSGARLIGANLKRANLYGANLRRALFIDADLSETRFIDADLSGARLTRAKLVDADFAGANLRSANLVEANLTLAYLGDSNLTNVDFTNANLTSTRLDCAILIGANLEGVLLDQAWVYGVNTWDTKGKIKSQKNLKITPLDEQTITVDNIEIAQFIYLLLNNKKIRDVIGTIAQKGVLILGRFTPERKKILDAIREKLRQHDFVPIMFDFEKITSRDFTETIKALAGMSRFIIADISNPSSSPLELQATVPDYMIPFVPIIEDGQRPFTMLRDLQTKYDWVLQTMTYKSESELMEVFETGIIERALEIENQLLKRKAENHWKSLKAIDLINKTKKDKNST